MANTMHDTGHKDQLGRRLVLSDDFKVVFANTMRLRMGDNDCALTFAVETDDQAGGIFILDQVQIILTPKSAKLWHYVLGNAVKELEKLTGPIPMPPQENLDKIMASAQTIKGSGTPSGQS